MKQYIMEQTQIEHPSHKDATRSFKRKKNIDANLPTFLYLELPREYMIYVYVYENEFTKQYIKIL